MRHKKGLGKLNRDSSHRYGMLRNLATSLVLHGTIETTIARAKELKRVADKLITLGKKDSLHARRQAMAFLRPINKNKKGNAQKWTAVHKLFTELAPMYSERSGGYTRVIRSGKRDGDNAQMAIIQFVEAEIAPKEQKRKRRKVARVEKTEKPEKKAVEETPKKEAAKTEEAKKEAQKTEAAKKEPAKEPAAKKEASTEKPAKKEAKPKKEAASDKPATEKSDTEETKKSE